MYKIVRHFYSGWVGRDGHNHSTRRTVKRGLTLEQAQAHCQDKETSSKTATSYAARKRTRERGPWFDGYAEE